MTIQHIPLTEVNRRMKQIRQFMHSDGLVVLTSHDKLAMIVLEVKSYWCLLCGAEHLAQLLAPNGLVEAARAISAADVIGLGRDRDWIRRTLQDLEPLRTRFRKYAVSSVRQTHR